MAKRVGLLTLSLNVNFGGIIQAVALGHWLTAQGCEVVLLDRRRPGSRLKAMLIPLVLPILGYLPIKSLRGFHYYEMSRRLHRPFIERNFTRRATNLRSSADMARAVRKHKLEAVIVGSDQVWRIDYMDRSMVGDFFLGFGEDGEFRRLSYAASFGVSTWTYPDLTAEVARLLARFDAVSVREASGVEICRDVFGRADAVHVLDPTLLVPAQFHHDNCAGTPAKQGKTVLCYLLDQPQIRAQVLAQLGPDHRERTLSLTHSDTITLPMWLAAFRDADFVLTDSFHGMIFSIVFERPFIAISNAKRGAARFSSLLDLLGLSDRLILDEAPERLAELVATPIDFAPVRARLAALRRESEGFLHRALG